MAQRRATLDLILHIESDGDLINARNEFTKIKKSNFRSSQHGKEENRDTDEASHIKTVLNINELVAVSIKEGVISERVFRTWFNGAFIDDYKQMTGYINEIRQWKKSDKIFQELELLAKRWESTNDQWYAKPGWIARKYHAFAIFLRA